MFLLLGPCAHPASLQQALPYCGTPEQVVLLFPSTGSFQRSSAFRQLQLTCWLGHTWDLVGQPYARQAEEGGHKTKDLHRREERKFPGQGPTTQASFLFLFSVSDPVIAVARTARGIMWPNHLIPTQRWGPAPGTPSWDPGQAWQPGLWVSTPQLFSSEATSLPIFGFMVTTELCPSHLLSFSWANKTEKGRIVHFSLGFKIFNIEMDFIGVVALFALYS